jgi:pyruvate-formate lyase
MVDMDTKQYLGQISRLDRMIKNKMTELSQYKDLIYGLSGVVNEERVQKSPDFDKMTGKVAKVLKIESKIDELIDEYVDKKNLIISQIDSMENEIYYEILFARYIEKKTFEKIADEMMYSWRQIIRLHGKALQEFEKIYGKTYKK